MFSPDKALKPRTRQVWGIAQAVTFVAVCVCFLPGCQTTGRAVITYPDGSRAELDFKKGVLDDMDLPGPDPVTGSPAAYIRVGTSKVAADTALQGYRETGEALRQYMTDRAAQNVER